MRFEDDINEDVVPALKILIAKHDKPLRGILKTTMWKGIWTHWYGKHTIACCGTDNCPACDVGMEAVKKYYMVARPSNGNDLAIFMITPVAAVTMWARRSKADCLLGMEVVLGRAAARNTAPMTANVINYHPDTPDFGKDRLERVMLRIFAANANLKVA